MYVYQPKTNRKLLKGFAISTLLLSSMVGATAFAQCAIAPAGDDTKWARYTATEADAVLRNRYEELCGLNVSATSGSHAIDDNPVAEDNMAGRLWFFTGNLTANAGDSVTIHQLRDQEEDANNNPQGEAQLSLIVRGGGTTGLELVAELENGATTTSSAAIPIDSTTVPYRGWHVVRYVYTQGNGNGSFQMTLDGGTPVPVSNLTNATIEEARLGAIASTGSPTGILEFDSYYTIRDTGTALALGDLPSLLLCDASGDGTLNNGDILRANAESANLLAPPGLAEGQADCNGDGNVNNGDVLYINAIVNNLVTNPNTGD